MSQPVYLGRVRVDITVRDAVLVPVTQRAVARAVAAAAEAAGAPMPASIGLLFSDDAELAELNATHLHERGPTDVLSFPLLPPEAFPAHAGEPHPAAAEPAVFPLPPGRRLHLGDVVISVERATEQAREGRGGQTGDVRWSPADELRLLATHGTLHLCGWDHAAPAEQAAMRALEARLLAVPASRRAGSPDRGAG